MLELHNNYSIHGFFTIPYETETENCEFHGRFKLDSIDRSRSKGYLLDRLGESIISDIKMDASVLEFFKSYIGKDDKRKFNLKWKNGIWIGEWHYDVLEGDVETDSNDQDNAKNNDKNDAKKNIKGESGKVECLTQLIDRDNFIRVFGDL